MKITVTKNDIRQGQMNSPTSCPVALAVQRATKDHRSTVGYLAIHIRQTDNSVTRIMDFALRGPVLSFVRAFDKGKRVKPLSFTLPIKKVGGKLIRI